MPPAKAIGSGPLAQRQQTLTFLHTPLARLMQAQERFLIPLQLLLDDAGPCERVLDEHRQLWQRVHELGKAPAEALPALLRSLGEKLEAHIRYEQGDWLKYLRQKLDPAILALQCQEIESCLSQD